MHVSSADPFRLGEAMAPCFLWHEYQNLNISSALSHIWIYHNSDFEIILQTITKHVNII